MEIDFYKYQGAGNDFVFLDNISGKHDNISLKIIQHLCDRRFGIGADGLIIINKSDEWDFEVDYYNSDGSKSFCGNGARCAVRFVNENWLKKDVYKFMAIDGLHEAQLVGDVVSLEMKDVDDVERIDENTYVLYTGSPHFIRFTKEINEQNMFAFGQKIRYSERFVERGINVNLVEELSENHLRIRTYERGVENETLACGTGITAAAIAYALKMNKKGDTKITLEAKGGMLSVQLYRTDENVFKAVHLIGPADFVFKGTIHV